MSNEHLIEAGRQLGNAIANAFAEFILKADKPTAIGGPAVPIDELHEKLRWEEKGQRPTPVPRPGLSLDPRRGFFSSTITDHFAAITAEIEKLESQPDRIHAANALRAVRRTLERAEGTDG
ncbi:hypothetical protein [Prescottella equi]|uniref:hypothetical protein n=1 Tax=Rhodococcus hoagii TaxID=43767 RepID=UPI000A0F463F|nr:hypothetical protein [Prescottella equi]ORL15394.1 hypothetical protein A6I85_05825 [Prescottella equi]